MKQFFKSINIKIYIIIIKEVVFMAKPIGETPTLYGKDAVEFLNNINKPLTKKDKEFKKRFDSIRKVSF